jgi:hypothetical protein
MGRNRTAVEAFYMHASSPQRFTAAIPMEGAEGLVTIGIPLDNGQNPVVSRMAHSADWKERARASVLACDFLGVVSNSS